MIYVLSILIVGLVMLAVHLITSTFTPMKELMPGKDHTEQLTSEAQEPHLTLQTHAKGVRYAASQDRVQPVQMRIYVDIPGNSIELFICRSTSPTNKSPSRGPLYEVTMQINGQTHSMVLHFRDLLKTLAPQAAYVVATWPKDLERLDIHYTQAQISFTYTIPRQVLPPSKQIIEQGWVHLQSLARATTTSMRPMDQWLGEIVREHPTTHASRTALLALGCHYPKSPHTKAFWKHISPFGSVHDVFIAYEIDPQRAEDLVMWGRVTERLNLLMHRWKDDRGEEPWEMTSTLLESMIQLLTNQARSKNLDEAMRYVLQHSHGICRATVAQHMVDHDDLTILPLLLESAEVVYQHHDELQAEALALETLWRKHPQDLSHKTLASYALTRFYHHEQRTPHATPWLNLLEWTGDIRTVEQLRTWADEPSWEHLSIDLILKTTERILQRLKDTQDGGKLSLAQQGSAGALSASAHQGALTPTQSEDVEN